MASVRSCFSFGSSFGDGSYPSHFTIGANKSCMAQSVSKPLYMSFSTALEYSPQIKS